MAINKAYCDYLLPTDAVNFLDSPLKTQFRCVKTGYFADIDNNCQMYHVCVVQRKPTGHQVIRQYSFVCGNNTLFNQLTMTCDDPQESLPCEDAPRYYNMNRKVGEPNTLFHTGNDYIEEDEDPGFNEENADYFASSSEVISPVYAAPENHRSRYPTYSYRPYSRSRYATYDSSDSYLESSESIEQPVAYPTYHSRRVKPEIPPEPVETRRISMAVDAPGIYTFPRRRNPKYGLL